MGAYVVLGPDRTFEVRCDEPGCENFSDPGCLNWQASEAVDSHDSWHEGLGDELGDEPDPGEYEYPPFESCDSCSGSGRRWYGVCRTCAGDGIVPIQYA